jgi:hypothetical protein
VTPSAFPVEAPNKGDGLLLYHQFGFPQRFVPQTGLVIEDIAHAFFSGPETGARGWSGEVALFSLPKFFALAGFSGGLVCKSRDVADRILDRIRNAPPDPPDLRSWMRRVVRTGYARDFQSPDHMFLESAYELLLRVVRPDPADLQGFPQSIAGIKQVGQERLQRVQFIREFFRNRGMCSRFLAPAELLLPFAFPYFGVNGRGGLERANRALEEAAIYAGVYHVDVNRDMRHPDYQICLLLPCHQGVSVGEIENMCKIVRAEDRA